MLENELMGNGLRLVVVARPRSGSNTLVGDLAVADTLTSPSSTSRSTRGFSTWLPANPGVAGPGSPTCASLDQVVDGIVAACSAGFELHAYQLDMELLAHLLLSRQDLRVVFLRRRNLPRGGGVELHRRANRPV